MDSEETPYLLPDGDRVWVIRTSTAGGLLPQMLERFRANNPEPLIFGDARPTRGRSHPLRRLAPPRRFGY